MNRQFALICLAACGGLFGSCTVRPEGHTTAGTSPAPISAEERSLAVQAFDRVWTTVRDRHFDPTLNGVDWNAVRDELRPKVEAARTLAEARAVINEALARLGQSHFGLIPRDAYEGLADDSDSADSWRGDGSTGVHARVIAGHAVVVKVDDGSPAGRAGVRPGWRIERMNGRRLDRLLKRAAKAYEGQVKQHAMLSLLLNRRLSGDPGEQADFVFRDTAGRRYRLTLAFEAPPGKPVVFGNLPAMHLEHEARRLSGGVGYLRLSVFFDPPTVMPWFRKALADFADAPGVILDLRGNPGGLGGMAMGISNYFVSGQNLRLGTMTTREATLNFVLNPQPGGYRGPLAIIVDEMSMSTSEILAGGLQAIGRARIFGVRTGGLALPSVVEKLPTGDGFQYALANYVSADGLALEGRGVIPDEPISLEPARLAKGEDSMLDAACAWILRRSVEPGGRYDSADTPDR